MSTQHVSALVAEVQYRLAQPAPERWRQHTGARGAPLIFHVDSSRQTRTLYRQKGGNLSPLTAAALRNTKRGRGAATIKSWPAPYAPPRGQQLTVRFRQLTVLVR